MQSSGHFPLDRSKEQNTLVPLIFGRRFLPRIQRGAVQMQNHHFSEQLLYRKKIRDIVPPSNIDDRGAASYPRESTTIGHPNKTYLDDLDGHRKSGRGVVSSGGGRRCRCRCRCRRWPPSSADNKIRLAVRARGGLESSREGRGRRRGGGPAGRGGRSRRPPGQDACRSGEHGCRQFLLLLQ